MFSFHWLQQEIHPTHQTAIVNVSRNPTHAWLTDLLLSAITPEDFVTQFIQHWLDIPHDPNGQEIINWLQQPHTTPPHDTILAQWRRIKPFNGTRTQAVRRIQKEQKKIALEIGGEMDQHRLALVDTLPTPASPTYFLKAGIIPRMACSQSCRHCMFVWRTPMKQQTDSTPLLHWLNHHTKAILFTGGDLTGQLPMFYQAIREMDHIDTFAILLNGSCASSQESADKLFKNLQQAQNQSSRKSPQTPEITLQISCDEFHQEIIAKKEGLLAERIPIANIANLVISATRFPTIRLVLLHKQNRLNFSTALFQKGIFARLARELKQRGHTIQLLNYANSPRIKTDPVDRQQTGKLIRDALFVLTSHPTRPIQFMSSTIDAYGRASLLDPSEFVNEKLYLQQILEHGPPPEERFDIDPMFRTDGIVSCFSASHIVLGNLYTEGKEIILARHSKDPLLKALARFDKKLLDYYQEVTDDIETILATATGPHQLFHRLTERAAIRLHMTERLLSDTGG